MTLRSRRTTTWSRGRARRGLVGAVAAATTAAGLVSFMPSSADAAGETTITVSGHVASADGPQSSTPVGYCPSPVLDSSCQQSGRTDLEGDYAITIPDGSYVFAGYYFSDTFPYVAALYTGGGTDPVPVDTGRAGVDFTLEARPEFPVFPAPTLSDPIPVVGRTETVTFDTPIPDGADVQYFWSYRNNQGFLGDEPTYTPTAEDIGHELWLNVTFSMPGYRYLQVGYWAGKVSATPWGRLAGRVVDGDGNPVENAIVTACDATNGEDGPQATFRPAVDRDWSIAQVTNSQVETDADGRYDILVPAGDHCVEVTVAALNPDTEFGEIQDYERYYSSTSETGSRVIHGPDHQNYDAAEAVHVAPDATVGNLDLTFVRPTDAESTGFTYGTIDDDETREPIAGATLTYYDANGLSPEDGGEPLGTVVADADGTYELEAPVGVYKAVVTAPGYAPRWYSWSSTFEDADRAAVVRDTYNQWSFHLAAPGLDGSAPTISGIAKVGQTLTAHPGTWAEGATLTYQWFAGGEAIDRATNATLVVPASAVGTTITVQVTGSLEGYSDSTFESDETAVVTAAVQGSTPTIVGSAKVGKTVNVHVGSWTKGAKLSYQWYSNGVAVKGANGATLVVPASALGKTLTVKVTGALAGYTATTTTSAATAKVTAGTLSVGKVAISGTSKVGKTVKVSAGTWTAGTRLTYQWSVNGKAVKGATGKSLRLATSMKGKKVTVTVTGTLTGYAKAGATSKAVVVG